MQVIPLKYGTMFKHAFGQPKIFCQFVKDILGIDIHINKVHTEYEYPKPIGFVRSKYDLFAEDKEQRIIVEIQHVKEEDFFNRFLYYHLISLVEQVDGYKEYNFERTVYTIVVLTSTPRDGSITFGCAVSDMNPKDEDGEIIPVYPHRLVFLCPRLVKKNTPPLTKKWLQFIEDSLDGEMNKNDYQDPQLQELIKLIQKRSINPTLLSEIKDDAAWEKAKGRFMQEGKEAGIAEGLQQGQLNIARALLDVLDDKTIAQKTKLTLAVIKKLRLKEKNIPNIKTS